MNKNVKALLAQSRFICRMTEMKNRRSINSTMSLRREKSFDDLRAMLSKVRDRPSDVFPLISYNEFRSVDLSVIIPVYNVEAYLEQCLDALFSEEARITFEVVAIDDGSTDSSGDILDTYARLHDNLRVFHFANSGVAAARNRGIELSRGKWLSFVDPDDIMPIRDLNRALNAVVDAGAEYAVVSYKTIDDSGLSIGEAREILKSDLSVAWGAIYKSEVWKTLRFPEGCWYEDTIISYLVWPLFSGMSFPGSTYQYRQRSGSIVSTTKGNPKGLDFFWLTETVIEEGVVRGVSIDVLATLTLKRMGPTMLFCSEVLDGDQMKALFLLCSEIIDRFEPICRDKGHWQNLETALRSRDYRRWLWCCLALALEMNFNGAKRAAQLLLLN